MHKSALLSLTAALFLASCQTATSKKVEAEEITKDKTKELSQEISLGTHSESISYFLDLASDKDPNLKIQTLGIHANYTDLVLVYRNDTNKPATGLRTAPSGDADAFFLRNLATKKVHKILATTGIPINDRGIDIHPGEEISFRLIFERIPHGTYELIEGKNQNEDWEYWNFSKIKLTK